MSVTFNGTPAHYNRSGAPTYTYKIDSSGIIGISTAYADFCFITTAKFNFENPMTFRKRTLRKGGGSWTSIAYETYTADDDCDGSLTDRQEFYVRHSVAEVLAAIGATVVTA